MKTRRLLIRNYGNLRDIFLDDLGDIAVFVDVNESEKANLLEAINLFFRGLDAHTGQTMESVAELIPSSGLANAPIDFAFVFEMDGTELTELLLPEVRREIGLQETNILEISSSITRDVTSATWHTQDIRVNHVNLMKTGKLVLKGAVSASEGMILDRISRGLRDKFKLARNLRGRPQEQEGTTEHALFLRERILSELEKLSLQNKNIEDTARMLCTELSELRFRYEHIPKQAQFSGQESTDENFHHDERIGELVNLYCQILGAEENAIVGIEEPENLDPNLTRQFIHTVKGLGFHHQFFIASHSPLLINEADLQDIWVLRKERTRTHVFKMKESTVLRALLNDFHLRPSDIFMARGLVFVETRTERKAFPIWAEKIGLNFGRLGLSIIPIYGKATKSYHFPVWINTAEQLGLPYYFVLNKSLTEQGSTMKIFKEKVVPHKTLLLFSKPSIEEYFPDNRILEALERQYGIKILEKEKSLASPKAASIEKLIVSKGKDPTGWNILIGDVIAKSMSINEIDDEIKSILLEINKNYTQRLRNQ